MFAPIDAHHPLGRGEGLDGDDSMLHPSEAGDLERRKPVLRECLGRKNNGRSGN